MPKFVDCGELLKVAAVLLQGIPIFFPLPKALQSLQNARGG